MWRLVLLAAPLVAEDHHGRWLRKLEADPAHACAPERLRELRELAAAGAVRADVVEEIRTPRDRTAKGARPERRQTILMDDDAGGATAFECREAAPRRPGRRRAQRSSASQHAVSRLDDKYTKRVVGEKTLLISVVDLANDFYAEASWGNFSLAVTYTPILEVDYDQSTCDDNDEIDWLGGGYDGDPDAFDVMAATASLAAGYDREDYDFNVVVIPYCQGNGAAGTGYVSQAGAFLNLAAYNYDPSFIHELGHNFGANHASYVDNDADNLGGKNAWYSDDDDWIEYGNLYSPMGGGGVEDGDLSNHFTVEGKLIFDWLTNRYVDYVEPYDASETPLCNPCVSVIQATDAGTLAPDDPVVVQISTATEDLYLFVEYRSQYSGALMTYSSYSSNSGMTGNFGNSRVVDCEPSTDLLTDAMCTSGENMQLDVGDEATSRPISVYFEVVGSHLEVSVYSSDTPRPTLSMAPTTAAPTQSPFKEDDQCGKEKYCCDFVDIDGYQRFYKVRDVTGELYCCSSKCTFVNSQNYYLQYVAAAGDYYVTTSEPCFESGTLSYIEGPITTDEMEAYCDLNQPTPAPVGCTADSTSWYKDGSPDKDCAWVAGDLGRCDSKEDAAGVLAEVGCYATCNECTPPDPSPTPMPVESSDPAPTPRPTAGHACVADSASWYKSGKPDKDCAWVAEDLERCDSKEDDAGVLASCDDKGVCDDDGCYEPEPGGDCDNGTPPRRDLCADTCEACGGVADTTSTVTGEIEISGEDEAWAEEHSEEIEEAICYAAETDADEVTISFAAETRRRRLEDDPELFIFYVITEESSDAAAAIYERMAALEPADFEEHIAAAFAAAGKNASAHANAETIQIFTPRHNAASYAPTMATYLDAASPKCWVEPVAAALALTSLFS
ncbi:tRNA-Phe hydroxylase [Aureococcus anophagefferens]|nr:tRNA-Phe hydroxylase [Aureococcus anophagefferens]